MPTEIVRALIERGVIVHQPETVWTDVPPERIAPGVEIFPGCRIRGAETSIGPSCRLGEEAPATLVSCRLGRGVRVRGGFAEQAVLLDETCVGSGAHLRPGVLLEEYASAAHSVGLKQTILMPWVTLGSLVNFCDCLMAGGTGPKRHGEVGSSYVHFNFTPHQDKATPSLIGDVPRGVMLDQRPIFLGGQGGLVGPTRMAFGTVVAAGAICRRDVLTEGLLVFDAPDANRRDRPYDLETYGDVDRIVRNNLIFAGNLRALAAWYAAVRPLATPGDVFSQATLAGGVQLLRHASRERLAQLEKLAAKIAARPGPHPSHRRLLALRPRLEEILTSETVEPPPESLLAPVRAGQPSTYVETIQTLPESARRAGTAWLQGIVDAVANRWEKSEP